VGSCVRSKIFWLGVPDGRLAMDDAGDRGDRRKTGSSGEKTGIGGTRTGNVAVEFSGNGDDVDDDGDGALDCSGEGGGGKTVGRPAVVPWV